MVSCLLVLNILPKLPDSNQVFKVYIYVPQYSTSKFRNLSFFLSSIRPFQV